MCVDLIITFCMISWSCKGWMMRGHGHHSLSPEEAKFTSALRLMQTIQFSLSSMFTFVNIHKSGAQVYGIHKNTALRG